MPNKQFNIRLSEKDRGLVLALSEDMGLDRSAVVTHGIRELAKRRGIKAESIAGASSRSALPANRRTTEEQGAESNGTVL